MGRRPCGGPLRRCVRNAGRGRSRCTVSRKPLHPALLSGGSQNRQRACRSQEQRRARLRQPRGGSSGRVETNRAQRPVGIAASAQRRFTQPKCRPGGVRSRQGAGGPSVTGTGRALPTSDSILSLGRCTLRPSSERPQRTAGSVCGQQVSRHAAALEDVQASCCGRELVEAPCCAPGSPSSALPTL